jgi:hypothetical protein
MRSHTKLLTLLLLCLSAQARTLHHFHVIGDDPGAWPQILSSIGLTPGAPDITVVRQGESAPPGQWIPLIENGAFVILEGDSDLARALAFRAGATKIPTRSLSDEHAPTLPIIWEKSIDVALFEIPAQAHVFARERWTKSPLVAGLQRGKGAVLWIATPPGEQGYERYPYLLQSLAALGLEPPVHSARLWAFFDTAYRSRVDVDYFAERWRKEGIGALHVAAWQHFETDPDRDAYLRRLIDACHRRAILVYAWLELPHVSEKFWADHPEWREKTALGQDAHLDWRKLMNLADPACFREAAKGVNTLLNGFDWDGANLSELYFESLEGSANLARFTPFNATVLAEFKKAQGASPLDALPQFLSYRADLAHRLQVQWLDELETARRAKPHLDLTLTHIDDRFDTRMRESLGADAARILPVLNEHNSTLLIEDPATIWHLGPKRYTQIWEKYQPLTKRPGKLAIDINIVERYQDVYPTKQQTGTELFELVHLASKSFPRVALYFESSILLQDAALLPAAAARAARLERVDSRLVVESPLGVGVRWAGNATVNGRPWPVSDGSTVWLPPGPQVIEASTNQPALRMLDFNGTLRTAAALANGVEFSYESEARAIAVLDGRPLELEIDGEKAVPATVESGGRWIVMLPRGQHLIRISRAAALPLLSTR